jgi:hypothetical protein
MPKIPILVFFEQGDQNWPFGSLFTLDSFFKRQAGPKTFWVYFFRSKNYVFNLTKKWVGQHFGRLFDKLILSPCF